MNCLWGTQNGENEEETAGDFLFFVFNKNLVEFLKYSHT